MAFRRRRVTHITKGRRKGTLIPVVRKRTTRSRSQSPKHYPTSTWGFPFSWTYGRKTGSRPWRWWR